MARTDGFTLEQLTPFFAKWPARITPGERFHAPVAHVDIFATAAAAAGASLPSDRVMDGADLVVP
jgi:arylsulfatase A-like enzyme